MNKLIFKTKSLCASLSSAKACLSDNNVIPILKCFRFRYIKETNLCEVVSYNQLNEMRIMVPVVASNCEADTMLAIEGEKLVGVLKTINSEEITITFNETKATFKHSEGQFSYSLEDPKDFPKLFMEPDEMIHFKVNIDKFSSSMRKTISFTDVSKDVPTSLCGVAIEIEKEKIYVCASDGYKMFYDEIPVAENDIEPSTTRPILIMPNSLKEASNIISLMRGDDIHISVSTDGRCLSINDAEGYYAFDCTLMELRPIKFRPLVKHTLSTNTRQIQVNAIDLKVALDRIKVMSDTYNNAVDLCGNEGADILNLNFENDLHNEVNEVVRLTGPLSATFTCKVNIAYFSLCVRTINDALLTINYVAEERTKSIVLANQDNDKGTLCFLMPCI